MNPDNNNDIMPPIAGDAVNVVPPPIWGHFTAGVCLLAFGVFFVGTALLRLRRVILSHPPCTTTSDEEATNSSNSTESGSKTSHAKAQNEILQTFWKHHLPEKDPAVLCQVSLALMATAVFGFLYEGFGVSIFDHVLHPDYSFFHYRTHMTATLLALLAGWTGWLESFGSLPRDSFRSALVFGFVGEVLLWMDHAANKDNEVNARLHSFLSLISLLTALIMGYSVARGDDDKAALVPYFAGYIGLIWQGLWFLVVAYHLQWNMTAPEHVTVLFVLIAVGLVLTVQLVIAYYMRLFRKERRIGQQDHREQLQEYSPLRLEEGATKD